MTQNVNQIPYPHNNNRIVNDNDLETQHEPFGRAVPITSAYPVANIISTPQQYVTSDRIEYGREHNVPPNYNQHEEAVQPQNNQNFQQESPMKYCAICGCVFSWIPIVGLITYCVNWNAPRGSQTRMWASIALCVSLAIIIFNLLYWTI